MGLLSRVTDRLTGGSDGGEVFEYVCTECDRRFEMSKTRMVGVQCPDCGSMNVRAAD